MYNLDGYTIELLNDANDIFKIDINKKIINNLLKF